MQPADLGSSELNRLALPTLGTLSVNMANDLYRTIRKFLPRPETVVYCSSTFGEGSFNSYVSNCEIHF